MHHLFLRADWEHYSVAGRLSSKRNGHLLNEEQMPCAAAPNIEYKRCSSCISGLGALTGYYQPGQLNPDKVFLNTPQFHIEEVPIDACLGKHQDGQGVIV
ncbi:hypothetical protein LAZ67_2004654 [Cordylochernes scorpioides]|uniref:Uncharacterized protein n=1 Tax=Cordylochernes scorpioides TaxID=51811 RepID=A0ABY6K5H1_9ARAC|nr:hypothetical protein LAZ67_2004654 [Cordylochernes scorpioides]